MLCYVVLYYVNLCYGVLCCVVLCYLMSIYVLFVMLCLCGLLCFVCEMLYYTRNAALKAT